MPLGRPTPKNAPKRVKRRRMGDVMHELKHGPVTSPARKATSGEQRRKQNIAIGLRLSGQSDKPSPKGRSTRRRRGKQK